MEEKKLMEPSGSTPLEPALPRVQPAKVYPVDGRERMLLPLAWGLGILFAELLSLMAWYWGLLVPVVVGCWYGVLFWYRGREGFFTKASLGLFGGVLLLTLTYPIFANPYFRLWNAVLVPVLVGLHIFEWSGGARWSWHAPRMVTERLGLLLKGFFCRLAVPFRTIATVKSLSHKRALYVLFGVGVSIPLLLVASSLLGSADVLFLYLTGGLMDWVSRHLSSWAARFLAGLFLSPFLFSLLYCLRRAETPKEGGDREAHTVDAALPITILLAMNGLYVLFLAVSFAALFGGAQYLAVTGVTYAQYARSGFFQLVAVAALNLTLGLVCVHFTPRTGRGWHWVRILSTLLVGASVLMLGSAAYRMTLYVMEYGLSFKRVLTYWGMIMLLIFFTAALMKIWRREFSFFKVLLTAGLVGWLVINYCNVDFLVAKYNTGRYGEDQAIYRKAQLADQAANWKTWSVAAQIGAMAKDE